MNICAENSVYETRYDRANCRSIISGTRERKLRAHVAWRYWKMERGDNDYDYYYDDDDDDDVLTTVVGRELSTYKTLTRTGTRVRRHKYTAINTFG